MTLSDHQISDVNVSFFAIPTCIVPKTVLHAVENCVVLIILFSVDAEVLLSISTSAVTVLAGAGTVTNLD